MHRAGKSPVLMVEDPIRRIYIYIFFLVSLPFSSRAEETWRSGPPVCIVPPKSAIIPCIRIHCTDLFGVFTFTHDIGGQPIGVG